MHVHSAITSGSIARFVSVFLLSLLMNACGGSDVGNQSDQRPPVADAAIIGLAPSATSTTKTFSTRANNKLILTGKNSLAPDVPIMTYEWEQISGEPVSLVAQTSDSAAFTTPNMATETELRFQLTVTDANNKTDTDTLIVLVAPVDDEDRFLANPQAPKTQLKILAALQGGENTGANAQAFSIQAVTIAHWRNRAGNMDQMEIHSKTRESSFPAQFSPTSTYEPFTEPRNPQLWFDIESVDIDTINQYLDDTERERRLEPYNIGSVYLEIQLRVINPPSVKFELFALNNANSLITGPTILSATPPTTVATNGALLQTWNNEFSALIKTDYLLAALGLDNKMSASNYYLLLDPTAKFTRLNDWLIHAGFKDENGEASTDTRIIHADYFNNYDLSYGRSTWMRKDADGNVFAYAINYPSVEDAIECHKDFSAFAMEYSDNPDPEGENAKIVKFYAFIPDPINGDYIRTNSINIDGRGEKMVPGVCTSCHQTNAAPSQFTTLADADLGAVFLPFDLDSFLYASADNPALIEPTFDASTFSTEELTKHSKETQEEAFRQLNLLVLATYSANPARHNAAIELVHGWYGDSVEPLEQLKSQPNLAAKKPLAVDELPIATFQSNYVQPGWVGEEDLYRDVFSRNCRTCHVQLENTAANFDTYDEFINNTNLISHVYEQGLMPLSRITMDRFWVSFYGEESSATILRAHLEALNQTIPNAPGLPVPKFTISPSNITLGTPVLLDASSSNFAASFTWSLTTPNGSSATLTNSSGLFSSFTPDIAGDNYDVSLTITNDRNETASLTQSVNITDLAPVAECFNANTSGLTNEGLLAAIPVMDVITNLGDGGVTIESVTNGALGVATISQDGLSINYQLNNPFVRGVDTITYRLQDNDGSLSTSSPNCTPSPTAGFARMTIDTTTSGTFAPSSVTATLDPSNNANQVILNWSAPTATTVDGYNLYRNGASTPINTSLITSTTFTDTGLSESTAYQYDVVSVIGSFKSNPSAANPVTTLSLAPTNIWGFSYAESNNSHAIQIQWTPPTGLIDSYVVYRDSNVGSSSFTLNATSTGFDDTNIIGGTAYTYRIVGKVGNIESAIAEPFAITSTPDQPTGVTVTAISDTTINVSWQPVHCDSGASYQLKIAPNLLVANTTLTTFTVSGLIPATDYTFELIAQCDVYSSLTYLTSSVTTLSIAPTGLTATHINTSQVDLNWVAAAGNIDSYRIYRNGTPVATIPAANTSYSDTSLNSGSQYNYQVTAIAGSYESPSSNSVTGTTYPEAPTAPLASPVSDTEITVSWAPVSCSTAPNYTLISSADHDPISTNAIGGTVGGLQADTFYTFVVSAECNGLTSTLSPSSSPIKTLSLAPTNLIAIASPTVVDLIWNPAFGNVDEYLIYRDGVLYSSVSGPQTSFEDMEISGGSTITYWVTALNGNTESSPSNTTTVTTVPDAPFSLFGVLQDPTILFASWGSPSCDGALSYLVNHPDVGSVSTNDTSITLTGLTSSSFHNFSVNAVCNGVVSEPASVCAGDCT